VLRGPSGPDEHFAPAPPASVADNDAPLIGERAQRVGAAQRKVAMGTPV
jgi:hypothetical protein